LLARCVDCCETTTGWPLDEDTAERLLTGRLAPADAPPGYGRVAAVLAVVSPPGHRGAGRSDRRPGALRSSERSRPVDMRLNPRRSQVITKLLTAKAAAAVLGVLMTGGVAAAATGNLPAPAQQAAHTLLGGAGVPAPAAATATTQTHAVGPDAAGPAARGLCRAWSAAKAASTATSWTRPRSRRWPRPPAAAIRSPPTAPRSPHERGAASEDEPLLGDLDRNGCGKRAVRLSMLDARVDQVLDLSSARVGEDAAVAERTRAVFGAALDPGHDRSPCQQRGDLALKVGWARHPHSITGPP
jgi:hypothetical protein